MSLTKRELEFCRCYVACKNSKDAAAHAGFAFPERSGLRLLCKQPIVDEIDRLLKSTKTAVSAVDGLKRIAFGSVSDAVKLVLGAEQVEPETLDLFMVSEIKRSDKGAVEIKFFDRIKALTALLEAGDGSDDSGTSQFVEAIFKGATAISSDCWSESDEV